MTDFIKGSRIRTIFKALCFRLNCSLLNDSLAHQHSSYTELLPKAHLGHQVESVASGRKSIIFETYIDLYTALFIKRKFSIRPKVECTNDQLDKAIREINNEYSPWEMIYFLKFCE